MSEFLDMASVRIYLTGMVKQVFNLHTLYSATIFKHIAINITVLVNSMKIYHLLNSTILCDQVNLLL